jgi:lipopolysaccharide/colanic/teichoic acid biosynthesis glycosyltransferase
MRHRLALLGADLGLIGFATIGAQLLRDNFEARSEQLAALLPYLAMSLIAALLAITALGLNRSVWRMSGMADHMRIVGATGLTVISAVLFGFLFNRLNGVARSLPIIQGFLIAFGLVGVRVFAHLRYTARLRKSSIARANDGQPTPQEVILLIGINSITDLYLRSLTEFAGGAIRVAGLLADTERHTGRLIREHRILGSAADVARILNDLAVHGLTVDRIVVTVPFGRLSAGARAALQELEDSSEIKVEFFAENIGVVGLQRVTSTPSPLAQNETSNASSAIDPRELADLLRRPYWRAKRVFDIIGGAVALTAASPLYVLVAVLVAVDVGLPILFWQYRPGKGGRLFQLLKFRTMGSAHAPNGRRVSDSERLSFIGCLLRRWRLDELPQLSNVLIGTMSFVGPRPLLPGDQFDGMPERLAVRPGLTGWAQIHGGRDLTASDKAALDLWYIKNASLRVDLKILLATLRIILFGERADPAAIRQAWRELRWNEPSWRQDVPFKEITGGFGR